MTCCNICGKPKLSSDLPVSVELWKTCDCPAEPAVAKKPTIDEQIASLQNKRDEDIDTSDIPEVKDWSGAVVGKFYRQPEPAVVSASPYKTSCETCNHPVGYHCGGDNYEECTVKDCACKTYKRAAAHPVAADHLPDMEEILETIDDYYSGVANNEQSGVTTAARERKETVAAILRPYFQGSQTPTEKWPQHCDLCDQDMESEADRTEWHGLGNCVPVCMECMGSGIEPASPVAPVSGNGTEPPNKVRSMAWAFYQVLGCFYGINGPARIMNWFWDVAHGEDRDVSELLPITPEERAKYEWKEKTTMINTGSAIKECSNVLSDNTICTKPEGHQSPCGSPSMADVAKGDDPRNRKRGM